ncbi:hypothetical protein KR222_007617 [Zaprionus bogoriensis]|nr:hypothetical protein KR222_007617 [Zaprionus bogoriensis]
MGTHTGRVYLNSCLKVPIDPCNNCPAPVYNRPKLCMGNAAKAKTPKREDAAASAPSWQAQAGIRSLAKFYDSIPDYCEVKHLHKAEFYSTLETLRTTSRALRTSEPPKERCTSASSSSCKTKQRSAKGKKMQNKKKKKPPPLALCSSLSVPELPANPVAETRLSSSCLSEEYDKCLRDLSRIRSFKHDFAIEVDDFKRSLKNFELEFKRNAERPKSRTSSSCTAATQTNARCQADRTTKMPAMHTAERAMLRRSRSVNDLSACAPPAAAKLSNYFPVKVEAVPKLHIESPSVSSSSVVSGSSRVRRRRTRKAKLKANAETEHHQQKQQKPPTLLSILQLEQLPKRATACSVSPQHPVARPNLAATLRAEVSRKKVKELKNNCTYHEPRPQFDWEVRKTPAWKSLSLNESHEALLSIRLATRKAEQALQERQYELHMQMMQQRVKSAPLLLEGPTYWGPEVGKLSHSCRIEGMRHACESIQLRSRSKQHKKKERSSSSRCCPAAATDAEAKLQTLRKIYGSQLKPSSRQSQRSSSRRRQVEPTPEPHDSGDDLCSVDRAFL